MDFILSTVLVQAAVTNMPRLSALKGKYLFLKVLKAGKSKVRVQAGSMSGKSLLPGLQMSAFSLYPHMAKSTEGGSKLFVLLFLKN